MNWRENRVVKKIIKLREEYEKRISFGGVCIMDFSIETLSQCDACGSLFNNLKFIYHKKNQNKTKRICENCSDLWRLIPETIKEERIKKLKQLELNLTENDIEIMLNEVINPKEPNEKLKKAAIKYKNKNI